MKTMRRLYTRLGIATGLSVGNGRNRKIYLKFKGSGEVATVRGLLVNANIERIFINPNVLDEVI